MLQLKILGVEWKTEFNNLASHPIQSWEWGEFREKTGNEVIRLGLFSNTNLIEIYQLTLHKIPKTKLKLAVLLKGPSPTIESLKLLKAFAQEQKIFFLRMEPNIPSSKETEKILKTAGAKHGRRFFTPSTFIIDLTKTEDELLANMHPKTRYNIKVANKHKVEISEETSEKFFNNYLILMDQTTKRQGFYAHTKKYHQLMWQVLNPAKIAHLLVAKYNNQPLIAWILFVWKDTLYYPYGASSEEHKNTMASYKMMWEAIKFGKSLGLNKFDLWGKEEGKGFSKFKEGFSPEVVEFAGTWDLIINKNIYKIYRITEEIRWYYLKLKTKIFPQSSFR